MSNIFKQTCGHKHQRNAAEELLRNHAISGAQGVSPNNQKEEKKYIVLPHKTS
jgi:hypothetical protein